MINITKRLEQLGIIKTLDMFSTQENIKLALISLADGGIRILTVGRYTINWGQEMLKELNDRIINQAVHDFTELTKKPGLQVNPFPDIRIEKK